jgi:ABC-type uncharacterized transport system auxiliary subunit
MHWPRFETHNSQTEALSAGNALIPQLKRPERHEAYLLRLASHATGVPATPRSSDLELSLCHTHTSNASSSTAAIITQHSATVNYVG